MFIQRIGVHFHELKGPLEEKMQGREIINTSEINQNQRAPIEETKCKENPSELYTKIK